MGFFSNPENLQTITPTDIDFKTLTDLKGVKMHAGLIIEYKIKVLPLIPFFWKTEITKVLENNFFIDVQLKGPYKIWKHEHHFRAIDGGVEMTDKVEYKNPLGILGNIAN